MERSGEQEHFLSCFSESFWPKTELPTIDPLDPLTSSPTIYPRKRAGDKIKYDNTVNIILTLNDGLVGGGLEGLFIDHLGTLLPHTDH